jgi:outer membrane protein
MKTIFRGLLPGVALALLGQLPVLAQTPATGQSPASSTPLALSLSQALNYAIDHKSTLKAARIDQEIATAKIKQSRAQGLPQISGQASLTDNYILQKSLADFSAFSSGAGASTLNPFTLTPAQLAQLNAGTPVSLVPTYTTVEVPKTGPQALSFTLPWAGSGSISASQTLFDGSYFVGLKAAKVYQQLSVRQTGQSEIDVVEQVSKAYYSTLVASERLKLLDRNVERLTTLLKQTTRQFEVGVVEKLDVQRLQVQLNNLLVQRQNTQRLIGVSQALLRFQMGLDQQQPVRLTDSLNTAVLETARMQVQQPLQAFNYHDRIEYQVLETQRDLYGLDVRNQRSAYLPKLSLTGSYGVGGSDKTLSGLMAFRGPNSRNEAGFANQNWFSYGSVGLQLAVPIFDGFRRQSLVQQAKLTVEKTNQNLTTLQQNIDLERAQSQTSLQNDLELLTTQRANLGLATEVARVAKVKFQAGVGTNVELITAETDLREAQTNYYAALYDALVAKVDFERANGTLYQPKL